MISASELALAARKLILKMTSSAGAPHVGSALSVVDILSVLYTGTANINPQNLKSDDRDIVILSKGHAASALYSVLALQGFFPIEWLIDYCENGSVLGGHVNSKGVPGVEFSSGSLGHGLPYGVGIALSRKRSLIGGHVYVVVSDGECDEGTTWESAMIANHFNLDNLTVIVDRNGLQSLTFTEDTMKLEPFEDKWKAFGWKTQSISGHDFNSMKFSLSSSSGPKCLIANTIKGKGIKFMENTVLWHYKSLMEKDLKSAISELDGNLS
jgi:transketolase